MKTRGVIEAKIQKWNKKDKNLSDPCYFYFYFFPNFPSDNNNSPAKKCRRWLYFHHHLESLTAYFETPTLVIGGFWRNFCFQSGIIPPKTPNIFWKMRFDCFYCPDNADFAAGFQGGFLSSGRLPKDALSYLTEREETRGEKWKTWKLTEDEEIKMGFLNNRVVLLFAEGGLIFGDLKERCVASPFKTKTNINVNITQVDLKMTNNNNVTHSFLKQRKYYDNIIRCGRQCYIKPA